MSRKLFVGNLPYETMETDLETLFGQAGTVETVTGVRVTCLSRRRFENPIIEKVDPHGRSYFWIAGTRVSWSRNKDADHEAIAEGAVSLTPLHLDSTNYGALDQLRTWESAIRAQRRAPKTRRTRR